MKKPFPALCKYCKHSRPERDEHSYWNVCVHHKVISKSPGALANNYEGRPHGVSCHDERSKSWWLAPCGMKGKLWEER